MIVDSDPELTEIKYISFYVEYINENLTLAYKKKEKKCWYLDSKSGNLIPVDYKKFFDKKGNLLN